jgi:putative lipoic acid-binding regulatory protein
VTEELLQFPCDFPIKVFGKNDEHFHDAAYEIVKAHVDTLQRSHIRSQASRQGRFVSLTINIRAESRAQVDAVYRDLSSSSSVLMVL